MKDIILNKELSVVILEMFGSQQWNHGRSLSHQLLEGMMLSIFGTETGLFWRALADKGLAEKGKHVMEVNI